MSIIKMTCQCGNSDPKKAKAYDGALGYEAIVCTECGAYADDNGVHPPDEWSLDFVGLKRKD